MSRKSKALDLKNKGNELFVRKEYASANAIYTDAISEDENNPVLYANRAACALALRRFPAASSDAKKAAMLDPYYSKAWARLASANEAMEQHGRSIQCWLAALDALPKKDLSPAELLLQSTYSAKLEDAKNYSIAPFLSIPKYNYLPWQRAMAVDPKTFKPHDDDGKSSLWAIREAFELFKRGSDAMKAHQKSGDMLSGLPSTMVLLSDGILRDPRVFRSIDEQWMAEFKIQEVFETQHYDTSWIVISFMQPELAVRKVQERIASQGWATIRDALSAAVRYYLDHTHHAHWDKMGHDKFTAAVLPTMVKFLELGGSMWRNIPIDVKGVIFDPSFLLGLRSLCLEFSMKACIQGAGQDPQFPVDRVEDEATDILKEIIANPLLQKDASFVHSFVLYPTANARLVLGNCKAQRGDICKKQNRMKKAQEHYERALHHFSEAMTWYPKDEEYSIWSAKRALDVMIEVGMPLETTLVVMKSIRVLTPIMWGLWKHSALAEEGRDDALHQIWLMEKDLLEKIESGELNKNERTPPQVRRRRG